jgi:hypothetical protein
MPVQSAKVDAGTTLLSEAEGRQLDEEDYDKHPFVLHKIFLCQIFQTGLPGGQGRHSSIGLTVQKY